MYSHLLHNLYFKLHSHLERMSDHIENEIEKRTIRIICGYTTGSIFVQLLTQRPLILLSNCIHSIHDDRIKWSNQPDTFLNYNKLLCRQQNVKDTMQREIGHANNNQSEWEQDVRAHAQIHRKEKSREKEERGREKKNYKRKLIYPFWFSKSDNHTHRSFWWLFV